MEELEVIVTFLLFNPKDSAVALPEGLSFVALKDVPAPEFEEHLKKHPEHADWAFSFVEFVRPKTWVLDGKSLILPKDGAIGVWFAPVDHSKLGSLIPKDIYDSVLAPSPDALLVLGLWIPDSAYVEHMQSRGHRAEYGMATLIKDSNGTYHGELRVDDLTMTAEATPHGDVSYEPDPFTQVFFEPGKRVEKVVILAGEDARERSCTAEWTKSGDHPVTRGVFLGPTFLNVEGPLKGSAYRITDDLKK
jgi:hypothetical protein